MGDWGGQRAGCDGHGFQNNDDESNLTKAKNMVECATMV